MNEKIFIMRMLIVSFVLGVGVFFIAQALFDSEMQIYTSNVFTATTTLSTSAEDLITFCWETKEGCPQSLKDKICGEYTSQK